MSDQEIGKKEVERVDLDYFLDEYRHVTGSVLEELYATERPDFICADETGVVYGVELTRVGHSPPDAMDRTILLGHNYIDLLTLVDKIYATVAEKSGRLKAEDWKIRDRTMLVLSLVSPVNGSLSAWFIDNECLMDDFTEYGFCEIWVADHSTVEPYRTVTLYGLYPSDWWGHHTHSRYGSKPYG